MTVWKQIKNTNYYVTNTGIVKRVFKTREPRILTQWLRCGYPTTCLSIKGKNNYVFIHAVVLEAFDKPRPYKKFCNHKNGIKTDNRIENLEWVTASQNNKHAYDTGLVRRKFFCKKGHEFSKQNPVINKPKGYKRCRICLYEYMKLPINKDKANARRRALRAERKHRRWKIKHGRKNANNKRSCKNYCRAGVFRDATKNSKRPFSCYQF